MRVVWLVLAILVAVGLMQTAIWIPLTRSWRKKGDAAGAAFAGELEASGERVVLGPERGVYRGGSAPYSGVSGNGTLVLTDRRLRFRKRTGGEVEVPTEQIVGVRQSKSFRSSRVGGQTHLVIATNDPAEVGFFVTDIDMWTAAVEALVSPEHRSS